MMKKLIQSRIKKIQKTMDKQFGLSLLLLSEYHVLLAVALDQEYVVDFIIQRRNLMIKLVLKGDHLMNYNKTKKNIH